MTELSMSMFATQKDYWQARALKADSEYADLLTECATHAANADDFADQIEVLTKQRDELLAALKTAWSVNRSCTGQMRRTAALITEETEKNHLRYLADNVDSTMDNIHEAITKAGVE